MPSGGVSKALALLVSMMPMEALQRLPHHMVLVPPPGASRNPRHVHRSPAFSEPHSVPKVHIRNRYTKEHWWMTREQWDRGRPHSLTFGDVVEFVNGWGQVTSRIR